jgi:hypothetical protein
VFDADEALHALETLDTEGRKALQLAGKIWEEVHEDALWKSERAEYLLGRLNRLNTDLGLGFDLGREMRAWELRHKRPGRHLTRHYLTELSRRNAELQDLRARLDRVLDDRELLEMAAESEGSAELRLLRRELEHAHESARLGSELAERQRERAEKAELERDHALAKITWMRAHGLSG